MKSVKLAVIAALSSFAVSAFALSPMQDSDLSAVSGQDGVSIAANLNIKVGKFEYTALSGGTFAMTDIAVKGSVAAVIDILTATQFHDDAGTILGVASDATKVYAGDMALMTGQAAAVTAFSPKGNDVVRIALPNIQLNEANNLSVSVDKMQFGTDSGSIGKIAMTNIRLAGTTAYIWVHKTP